MKRLPEFRTLAMLAFLLLALLPFQLAAQCTNCPPGSTYSGTFNASTTNLSGYHPCLAINGIYDVNVNVTITSSFIYLGPNAQIRVQSGATLTLNDCTIQGCNAMWQRILVNSGGKLVASDCDVIDGIDGFDARGSSEMDVHGCTFTNNFIGIFIRNKFSTVPPTGTTFTLPLSNNIFQTSGGLKPPFAGQLGHAGVKAQNAAPVNIGASGYPQNQFLNLANGVVSENSVVVVENALFQPGQSCLTGGSSVGINATGGSVTVSKSTFNNCFKGVVSSACNLTATDNTLASVCTCFEVLNSAGRRVRIIDNVMSNTFFYGVNASNNGAFQEFLVDGNEIEMDFSLPGFSPIAGVQLNSGSTVNQDNVKIRDNDIDMYGAANGVNVLFNRNTDIEGNDVLIVNAPGLSPSQEHGIRTNASGNSSILSNTVTAQILQGSASEMHAIELNNSENTVVCGNTVGGADVGFKFNGQNGATNFSNNVVGSSKIGVFVGNDTGSGSGAFMGVQAPNQKARDNQWSGTYSLWGAQNENTDPIFIGLSRFHVRNTSQPQMPPSINASGWFVANGIGLNFFCPAEQEPDDDMNTKKSVALGTMPFTDYAVEQHWRARTTLYRNLKENPALLGQDQDVDAFYYSSASGIIGAFQAVAEGISGLGVPDAQAAQEYASLEAQIASKMSDIASIDAQLLTASGSVYEGLVEQRRTISGQVFALHDEVLALDESVQAAREADADQLLALNASINATTLPQQYLKAVNDVYLSTVGKGVFELKESQVADLEPIAKTCIREGGDAVLGARVLLVLAGSTEVYNDDLLCTPPQLLVQPGQGGYQVAFWELSIMPNPAKGQAEVRFPAAERERVLQVLNLQGMLMYSAKIGEGQVAESLPLESFPSGIYHVSLKGGDRPMAQKLVVMR